MCAREIFSCHLLTHCAFIQIRYTRFSSVQQKFKQPESEMKNKQNLLESSIDQRAKKRKKQVITLIVHEIVVAATENITNANNIE